MNRRIGRRAWPAVLLALMLVALPACASTSSSSVGIIGGAKGPTAVYVSSNEDETAKQAVDMALHQEVDNSAINMEVTLGYDGAITYAKWIPITVNITNSGKDISGSIAVNAYRNNVYYDRYEIPVTIAAGATQRVVLPFCVNMKQSIYTVELTSGGEVLEAVNVVPARTISPYALLVGFLANDPQSLKYMDITTENDTLKRGESWQSVALDAESFPADARLMRSFGLLVVDGFDVRTLSETQREVLVDWISQGGIVILGGGANAQAAYGWFSEHTGITTGGVYETAGLTAALSAHVNAVDNSVQINTLFNEISGGQAIVELEEKSVLCLTKLGKGVIFTAAFELGTRSFTQWGGAHTIWQRILLEDAPSEYIATFDRGTTAQINGLSSMAEYTPVENRGNLYLVYGLLFIFLLCIGLGGYWLLKKIDKREWMWVTVPLCVVLATGIIFVLSRNTELNTPIASESILWSISDTGDSEATLAASVAYPDMEEMVIGFENGMDFYLRNDYSYYYDYEEQTQPKTQYYRYIMGDNYGIGIMPSASWSSLSVVSRLKESPEGTVFGSVWMEEDGLHAEITNDSPYTLKECLFICVMGFARVPEMAPGDTVTVHLRKETEADAEEDTTGSTFNPYSSSYGYYSAYKEGVLGVAGDAYSVASSAMLAFSEDGGADSTAYTNLQNAIYNLIDLWSSETGDYSTMSTGFRLVAFVEDLEGIPLTVNGTRVQRSGVNGILSAKLSIEPVGRTGLVYYPAGSVNIYHAQIGTNGLPEMTPNKLDQYTYLQNEAICGFQLDMSGTGAIAFESLTITTEVYGNTVTAELYDFSAKAWVAQSISAYIKLEGEAIAPYIGENGEVYLRLSNGNSSGNYYMDFRRPVVTAEGKVK